MAHPSPGKHSGAPPLHVAMKSETFDSLNRLLGSNSLLLVVLAMIVGTVVMALARFGAIKIDIKIKR